MNDWNDGSKDDLKDGLNVPSLCCCAHITGRLKKVCRECRGSTEAFSYPTEVTVSLGNMPHRRFSKHLAYLSCVTRCSVVKEWQLREVGRPIAMTHSYIGREAWA